MFWCGWSSPFPKALWQPELLSPPCQWGTISFVTAQARSSGAKGTLPWTQHLVQLASTDPFTGAILYSLQRSNPTNQLDPWEKFFLKAHIWWCNLLREDHCAPIWGCRKEAAFSSVLDTFIFLLLWVSEKTRSFPAIVCLERTKMWTKESAGWIPIYSWKWTSIQPAVWMAGREKRVAGLGTPTGSQPVQFLNLFLHLQPVKRKHTDKYNERQHNSTAVFLQRAEMKFSTFSLVLPLTARAKEPLFLAKIRFSPAFSWQWFCVAQIRNYARRTLWYSAIYLYAILNELEAILDDYNVSAS